MFRIPLRQTCRAFPELDRFTDEQCALFVQRIRNNNAQYSLIHMAGFVIGAVILVVIGMLMVDWHDSILQRVRHLGLFHTITGADLAAGVISLATPPLTASLAGLMTRDVLLRYALRRAIRGRIDRFRCLECKYALIGQTPSGHLVRCPECGHEQSFIELGVEKR